MSITIDLAPDEEKRLREMAAQRGIEAGKQAREMLASLLQQPITSNREALMAAAKAGDREAWLELLDLAPPIAAFDPGTGQPTPVMSREALSREFIYED